MADRLRGFRKGLKETGYLEGETLSYRVPVSRRVTTNACRPLTVDLVRRQVKVLVAGRSHPPALAAKTATTSLPYQSFIIGSDRVEGGVSVTSLNRPGGNITGVRR